MITIYHNSRCSKSRQGLELIKNSNKDYEVIEYLKEPLNEKDIEDLLIKLKLAPIQIVRQNETIWKDNYKGKDLSDNELIRILAENPKLMERPIVVRDKEAVLGRPTSNIEKLFK